ncbi:CoA transferase [Parafrankia sp. FMc2]|uniref:CoA transferase n=1 Tax=Parafrankia sp. FMc2 TaxID=3233196 RepID=UPI0034D5F2A5
MRGLLAVDLARVSAGPFATMMCADLGARRIKVERPGRGDDSRTYDPFIGGRSMYFARVNRSRQSIVLDLRCATDRDLLLRIVDQVDVLVENYRPGVMERAWARHAPARCAQSRLIFVSISGSGQTGPWRECPAYDTVAQAASGMVSITGRAGEGPFIPGVPIVDLAADSTFSGPSVQCAARSGSHGPRNPSS